MDIRPADGARSARFKACKEGRSMIAYARPSLEWKLVERVLCKPEAQARQRRADEPWSLRRSGAESYELRAVRWRLLR
jgi:hypothetical protein